MPATTHFLQRYFRLRQVGEGHKNFDMLLDDDGLVLTLIGAGRNNTVSYPKTFHIGFIQATDAAVDDINERLKGDRLDVEAPSHQRGGYAFSFQAPGGFRIVVRSKSTLHPGEQAPDSDDSDRHMRGRHDHAHG